MKKPDPFNKLPKHLRHIARLVQNNMELSGFHVSDENMVKHLSEPIKPSKARQRIIARLRAVLMAKRDSLS